jgi:hypothetical protein
MALSTAGRNFIAQAIINDTPTFFSAANAFVGVGDSTDAFDAADTDLQASTNKKRIGMVTDWPKRTTNALEFKASFGASDGNFAWAEWAVFNAETSGTMLSRKVEALGTKSSGTWVLTVTLTVTAA